MKHCGNPKRLESLDGVRGWAALAVLMSHLICGLMVNLTELSKAPALRFFLDGHLAVFVFFILSGFALTIKFVEYPDTQSVMKSVAARYFRLTPPIALTSALAYLLLKCHLMFNIEAAAAAHAQQWAGAFYTFKPSLGSLLYFSFYSVFFDYDLGTSYNSNLWTMPLEFLGSMIAFSTVAIFVNPDRKFFMLPVVATVVLLLVAPALSCFIFGYILAECHRSSFRNTPLVKHIALATLPLAIGIRTTFIFEPVNDTYYALLAGSIVFAFIFSPSYESFFSSRLSRFFGKISFPLYLIQIPIICSYSSYLLLQLDARGVSPHRIAAIVAFTTATLAIAVAWLLSPVERYSVLFSHRAGDFVLRFLSVQRSSRFSSKTTLYRTSDEL